MSSFTFLKSFDMECPTSQRTCCPTKERGGNPQWVKCRVRRQVTYSIVLEINVLRKG